VSLDCVLCHPRPDGLPFVFLTNSLVTEKRLSPDIAREEHQTAVKLVQYRNSLCNVRRVQDHFEGTCIDCRKRLQCPAILKVKELLKVGNLDLEERCQQYALKSKSRKSIEFDETVAKLPPGDREMYAFFQLSAKPSLQKCVIIPGVANRLSAAAVGTYLRSKVQCRERIFSPLLYYG
jgi:hypothetical protein